MRVEIEITRGAPLPIEARLPAHRYRSLTKNQDDKVVQSFTALAFVPTRSRDWLNDSVLQIGNQIRISNALGGEDRTPDQHGVNVVPLTAELTARSKFIA